jgi:hypothetical protein
MIIMPVVGFSSVKYLQTLLTLQRRQAFKSLLKSSAGGYLTN